MTDDVRFQHRLCRTASGAQRSVLCWQPSRRRIERNLLLFHGYAEHAGRYDLVARALAAGGVRVIAADLVGHGRSPGPRGEVPDLAVEATIAVEIATRSVIPGDEAALPLTVFGHSMGGISALLATGAGPRPDSLILSSPGIGGWRAPETMLLRPALRNKPISARHLSPDPSAQRAYEQDDLVWRGPFPESTLMAMRDGLQATRRVSAAVLRETAVLWLHGEQDRLVPVDEVREGFRALPARSVQCHLEPTGRHELLHDRHAPRAWAAIADFLGLESGAR